jgi:NADP-dependent 3-hydroxy acid dehydrogenase YdfG
LNVKREKRLARYEEDRKRKELLMAFTGKVAFVTGAGSGIGKATAVLLA